MEPIGGSVNVSKRRRVGSGGAASGLGGARGRLSGSLRDVRPLGEDFHSVLANGPFQDGDGSKGIGLEMFFQGRVLKQKVVGGDVFLQ